MRKILLTLALLSLLSVPQVFAVEYVATHYDGTKIFTCEMKGAVFKLKVRETSPGKYHVLVLSKGTTGYSGTVYADNFEAAARVGCGGE